MFLTPLEYLNAFRCDQTAFRMAKLLEMHFSLCFVLIVDAYLHGSLLATVRAGCNVVLRSHSVSSHNDCESWNFKMECVNGPKPIVRHSL